MFKIMNVIPNSKIFGLVLLDFKKRKILKLSVSRKMLLSLTVLMHQPVCLTIVENWRGESTIVFRDAQSILSECFTRKHCPDTYGVMKPLLYNPNILNLELNCVTLDINVFM